MLNTSLSPWPSFTQEEADAVSKVLLSNKVNYWTGTECREFEKEFAAFVGTQYAVALSNGTLALDVAFKAMGIGAGDDVIVTFRRHMPSEGLSCGFGQYGFDVFFAERDFAVGQRRVH